MTNQAKIMMLEEIMEIDQGMLNEKTVLGELEEWNSMAALSLIVLMDEEFGKKLTGKQIKEFQTVKDILDYMN
jgi:acyl carrier protein